MMELSLITKLYESSHFTTNLIIVMTILVLLFSIILFLGIKDLRKRTEDVVVKPGEEKDITFEQPKNEYEPVVHEDVTFEAPTLTQNLADFKNVIEQEIKQEQVTTIEPVEKVQPVVQEEKPIKIFDIDEIENTAIFPALDENDPFAFRTNDDDSVSLG